MIEKIKNLFHHSDAANAAAFGLAGAETETETAASVARAEENVSKAKTAHSTGGNTAAAIYYAEAITLFRNAHANDRLAYALRHAAQLRSQMKEYAVAASHIQEALRLYYAMSPQPTLEIASALRITALNSEQEAIAAWREAEALYAQVGVHAGITEAQHHLEALKLHKAVAAAAVANETQEGTA